jgi:hypothetical protein
MRTADDARHAAGASARRREAKERDGRALLRWRRDGASSVPRTREMILDLCAIDTQAVPGESGE